MTKVEKKAVAESIAHWKRMISWARRQDQPGKPDAYVMYAAINEDWFGDFCPLCGRTYDAGCDSCPLSLSGNNCNNNGSSWNVVDNSETWEEWIANAELMQNALKNLK